MRDGYIDKLYGRRQAKPLKPRQERLMAELLPRLSPSALMGEGPLDPRSLFDGVDDVHFEIGFGGGEHLVWQAKAHPDAGFIGAEPFINGVGKLLAQIDDEGLQNIRILHGDARPLLERIAAASLSRIYVLHPDPWPKKRHHKRRIVSPWFFIEAARTLKDGGEARVASDIPDYVRWTLMHARSAPNFRWTAERAEDWRVRRDDWPQTRYEAKARGEGRPPAYLIFQKRPVGASDRLVTCPRDAC